MPKYNKKIGYYMFFIILLITILPMVMSAPPQETITGLYIRTSMPTHVQKDMAFDVHAHVFDVDTGLPVIEDLGCHLHLYTKDGHHQYEGYDEIISHNFDYGWDVAGGNLTQTGTHTYIIQCNGTFGATDKGGFISGEFYVNGYGEPLETGASVNFTGAMAFLFLFFALCLMGVVGIKNPLGKVACYFTAHILFIVGTFSGWQFNQGYGTYYLGVAGIYKVLFYFSAIALFPMIILSIAGMIIYYASGKKIQELMDHGMPEAEAYKRQGRAYK